MDESGKNQLWKVWDNSMQITDTVYTIKGFSIAALRTNFYIKELGIMLDAGLSGNIIPEYIFITHQHSDHMANLPYHLYGNINKIQIFVPENSKQKFIDYINSAFMLSTNVNINEIHLVSEIQNTIITGIKDDSADFEILIKKGNKKINVEIIKCYHHVPCIGFGFSEKKNKLKDEYKSFKGNEIKTLRDQNVEIYNIIIHYFFLFLGDTSKTVLEDQRIYKYKNIMIECTFIFDTEIDQAEKTKHMHWNYLKHYILNNPQINFILYHFSQRYKRNEITDFFAQQNMPNIIPWNSA